MLLTLSYSPGQVATVFLETLDGYGQRADGYSFPVITRIVYPDLSLAAGYPTNMTQLDVGLYYYQFVLPTGAIAVGSYLVDIAYGNPSTGYINTELYQVAVTAPYGNFGTGQGPNFPPPRPPPDHNYPHYEPIHKLNECPSPDTHCCPPGQHDWKNCGGPPYLCRFFHGGR